MTICCELECKDARYMHLLRTIQNRRWCCARYSECSDAHRFLAAGSQRLRIFSNGSVGVGDYSSTDLGHAVQAWRTSGSTDLSSKDTGGNAISYAEALNQGNPLQLELTQAGTGHCTLDTGS